MQHRRTIRRLLAISGILVGFAAVVVVAENAGNAAGPPAPLVSADPTGCAQCADCAAEPTAQPSAGAPLRSLTTPGPGPQPSDSPTADPVRWDRFQYTFRVDIDAKFKPTFNAAKSGADPATRSDAIDEIQAGEDRRHNCYTLTFDGPLDLECDETNRGVQFFGDENRTNQKLSRVSVERVTRQDGEVVLRFVYRFPRFQEKGFYDIGLNCKTPAAP